jgi:tetratricopeptide (TPR) repeat protein
MRHYLDQYGKRASETRQKTLYHIDLGMAARLIGDLQTAEEEFRQAIVYGKGDEKKKLAADPLNVWYAHLDLSDLYLEYHLPDKSLRYLQEAMVYVANRDNFLSSERLSDYWLRLAQAFVQRQEMDSAQTALAQAKKQFIDSPVLRAKRLFSAARIHENLGQVQEAADMLTQAREICKKFGMAIHEINAILQQVALAFKVQKGSQRSVYPAAELENLIAKSINPVISNSLLILLLLLSRRRLVPSDTIRPSLMPIGSGETEALSRLYDQEQRLVFNIALMKMSKQRSIWISA